MWIEEVSQICLPFWLLLLLLTLLNNGHHLVTGELHLSASAPVNPAEHGGIFSLQCQVKDLPKGHRVEIYRHLGDQDEGLSVDDSVLPNVDDRVFLAVRHMGDGSAVYFLSIIDITKADAGLYQCKVIRATGNIAQVAVQSVNMSVYFFPSETSPMCSPSDTTATLQVLEGSVLHLNCSSEKGHPTVGIRWTRTNGGVIPGGIIHETDDRIHAKLAFLVTRHDDHAMFICEITSDALPNERRSCHVGPITVIPDNNIINHVPSETLPLPIVTEKDQILETVTASIENKVEVDTSVTHRVRNKAECAKLCSTRYSGSVFYWVIATAVCVLLGLVFLIFGVIIFLKFKEVNNNNNRHRLYETRFMSERLAVDDIYAEVENKMGSKPYMSLDRAQKCSPTLIPNHLN